jgi:hypothetical protein
MGKMICRFWWAQQNKERKMHWVSWEQMCKTKEKGGLGYRDLHMFNLATLVRQGWRLIQNPNSLCAQILLAKYSLLEAKEEPGISYSWRNIIRGVAALQKGLIWRIGDGSNIRIWEDPWISHGVTRRPITPRRNVLLTRVSELLDPETSGWDELLVRDIF